MRIDHTHGGPQSGVGGLQPLVHAGEQDLGTHCLFTRIMSFGQDTAVTKIMEGGYDTASPEAPASPARTGSASSAEATVGIARTGSASKAKARHRIICLLLTRIGTSLCVVIDQSSIVLIVFPSFADKSQITTKGCL